MRALCSYCIWGYNLFVFFLNLCECLVAQCVNFIIYFTIMNKIYSEPVSKAQLLITGVKEQAMFLEKKGIVVDVEKLQQLCVALEEVGIAQEAAEENLKTIRAKAHSCLDELKECYAVAKSPIKQNFSPETWLSFGVPDKK